MFIVNEDIYIEHFGVKGMQWGVRKKIDTSSKKPSESRDKRIAIVLGSAATATAIIAGSYFIKKHSNTRLSAIPKASEATKKFSDALAKEPVALMHSSRGRERGYMVLRKGGLKDPETEFLNAGMEFANHGYFKKYGEVSKYGGLGAEKVAVAFNDPLGRKDRAG